MGRGGRPVRGGRVSGKGTGAAVARPGLAIALLAGLPFAAAPLHAQWVEPPGKGWVTLAVYHQDTRRHYDRGGGRRAFFAEGHAVSTATFLTGAAGLAPGVDLWAQISFQRLRYDDSTLDRVATGPGDARLWLRVAPLAWLGSSLPVALRAGVKLPVGDFNVVSDFVPLGDGQRDWEIIAEAGHSFWPRSAYLSGWVGYRWREENRESLKDHGDELFYFVQAGAQAGRWGCRIALDGWDGASGVTEGVRVPSFQRDLVQLQPSLTRAIGPGEAELGVRFTLAGRNIPAGSTIVSRYFMRWGR